MFTTIEEVKAHVEHLKTAPPYEINEHLATFQRLAADCDTICEFGVATGTSTWAFLSTEPKRLRSYDIVKFDNITNIEDTARSLGMDFEMIVQDTGADDFRIEPCDLLFIDSMHNGWHVEKELRNAYLVSKYILFHDTEKYGRYGHDLVRDMHPDVPGILVATDKFLADNTNWRIKENYSNNNGLLVIERC